MRCSAIVVTTTLATAITACLEALTREDCEIIVVDNASADDTVQRVEEFVAWNPLRLLANQQNRGFGAAVNQGAREAAGDLFLFLNPDAIAEPGAASAMLRCLESTGADAVGGALLEEDGQPARGFAFRRLPTLWALIFEATLVNQLWPGNPVNRRYRCLDADYSQQQEVEQPAGACFAIKRTTFEESRRLRRAVLPCLVRRRRPVQAAARSGRDDLLLSRRPLPPHRCPQCGTTVVPR